MNDKAFGSKVRSFFCYFRYALNAIDKYKQLPVFYPAKFQYTLDVRCTRRQLSSKKCEFRLGFNP